MTTVILGLVVFSVLVIFHELGHFWAARAVGVRVERFSVGFGPVVLSRMHRGVQFAISAFPLGGYVKMGGDDPRDRENLRPGDLFAAAWWKRVVIALAGPGANFLLAILLGIVLMWVGVRIPDAPNRVGGVAPAGAADSAGFRAGDRLVAVTGVPMASLQEIYAAVGEFLEDEGGAAAAIDLERDGERLAMSVPRERVAAVLGGLEFPIPPVVGEVVMATPAYKAGLAEGDRVLAVDGEAVASWTEMAQLISARPGRETVLRVERGERRLEIPVTPAEEKVGGETVGRIGIAPASAMTYVIRFGFGRGIVEGSRAAVEMVGRIAAGIVMVVSSPSNLSQLSGPVAIIQASGDAAKAGWDRLLNFGILISVALMVFNLLPIPILDGGMVLLSVLEAVRRRPLGNRGLAIYQGIGMAVLGTLLVFVLINDPLRILQRQSALNRIGDIAP